MTNTTHTEDESADDRRGLVPVSSRTLHVLFYAAALVWVVFLLYLTRDWTSNNQLFPRLVGVPFVVLLLLQLARLTAADRYERAAERVTDRFATDSGGDDDVTKALEEKLEESKASTGDPSRRERHELYMIAWTVSLPIALYHFGFANTIPVYLFGFVLFFTGEAARSAIITITTCVVLYLLFGVLLGMPFWEGVFGLPNLLDVLPV